GIELFSNHGDRQYYRGLVRNVELPDDARLRAADARIGDVAPADASKFRQQLQHSSCYLLHLAEGTNDAARSHFLALRFTDNGHDQCDITPALAGIHCSALRPEDFDLLRANGGALVWSPLSNLLLYGDTAKVKDAAARGVLIGVGADWSPSGSKNLLGEMKV